MSILSTLFGWYDMDKYFAQISFLHNSVDLTWISGGTVLPGPPCCSSCNLGGTFQKNDLIVRIRERRFMSSSMSDFLSEERWRVKVSPAHLAESASPASGEGRGQQPGIEEE